VGDFRVGGSGRRMSLDDSGCGNHGCAHESSSGYEDSLAVDALGHEKDESKASGDLDCAEDGGQQQVTVSSVPDEERKVLWTIVCEGCGTGGLLSGENCSSGNHTLEVGLVGQQLLECESFPCLSLDFDTVSDLFHLELRIRTTVGSDPCQTLPRLFVAPLQGEPTCRFRNGKHTQTEKSTRDELDTDRNLPLTRLTGGDARFDTVVDPVTRKYTKGIEQLVKAANLTANGLWSHLTAEHRDNDTAGTETQTGDEAEGAERGEGASVDSLDESSNAEDDRATDE